MKLTLLESVCVKLTLLESACETYSSRECLCKTYSPWECLWNLLSLRMLVKLTLRPFAWWPWGRPPCAGRRWRRNKGGCEPSTGPGCHRISQSPLSDLWWKWPWPDFPRALGYPPVPPCHAVSPHWPHGVSCVLDWRWSGWARWRTGSGRSWTSRSASESVTDFSCCHRTSPLLHHPVADRGHWHRGWKIQTAQMNRSLWSTVAKPFRSSVLNWMPWVLLICHELDG